MKTIFDSTRFSYDSDPVIDSLIIKSASYTNDQIKYSAKEAFYSSNARLSEMREHHAERALEAKVDLDTLLSTYSIESLEKIAVLRLSKFPSDLEIADYLERILLYKRNVAKGAKAFHAMVVVAAASPGALDRDQVRRQALIEKTGADEIAAMRLMTALEDYLQNETSTFGEYYAGSILSQSRYLVSRTTRFLCTCLESEHRDSYLLEQD